MHQAWKSEKADNQRHELSQTKERGGYKDGARGGNGGGDGDDDDQREKVQSSTVPAQGKEEGTRSVCPWRLRAVSSFYGRIEEGAVFFVEVADGTSTSFRGRCLVLSACRRESFVCLGLFLAASPFVVAVCLLTGGVIHSHVGLVFAMINASGVFN